ncbi:hypothetical protein, partial [Enterobacter hormaechei]
FDHALDEPGGGDGLHTVFPLKMPGGGVVYPAPFNSIPRHPTAPRASFFNNTRAVIKKKNTGAQRWWGFI